MLAHCHLVDSATASNLSGMSMMEVVQHVIDILVRAMNCRLHRRAHYDDDDRGGGPGFDYHRAWIGQGKPEELAILHFVNQYRAEVDAALRQLLGERYERWERDEDEKPTPGDLVL